METKNLCAQIPLDLHCKVREGQAQAELTLNEYVTKILTEYFEGERADMANTRTLAFQNSEELFQRIKAYLAVESERRGTKLSQREFVIGLIEQALEEAEKAEAPPSPAESTITE